jgi:hypothetical protein
MKFCGKLHFGTAIVIVMTHRYVINVTHVTLCDMCYTALYCISTFLWHSTAVKLLVLQLLARGTLEYGNLATNH